MAIKIPTKLTANQIREYQRIYEQKYGENITSEKAAIEGLRLIRLVAIIIDKAR